MRRKAFATGLISALCLLVAIGVLGMVYSRGTQSESDLSSYAALTVSRRFADGLPFVKHAFEDAAVDSAFAKGCSGADFCAQLNARQETYSAKALEYLVQGDMLLYDRLNGFSFSCQSLPVSPGFDSSFEVNASGSYSLWAGNSTFAFVKKSAPTSWNWTVDLKNSTSFQVAVNEAGKPLRSISVPCS